VLITYNENVDLKNDYMYLEEVIVQNFNKIRQQSNENFPENENTEYLLLVGQKRKDILTWNSKVI